MFPAQTAPYISVIRQIQYTEQRAGPDTYDSFYFILSTVRIDGSWPAARFLDSAKTNIPGPALFISTTRWCMLQLQHDGNHDLIYHHQEMATAEQIKYSKCSCKRIFRELFSFTSSVHPGKIRLKTSYWFNKAEAQASEPNDTAGCQFRLVDGTGRRHFDRWATCPPPPSHLAITWHLDASFLADL